MGDTKNQTPPQIDPGLFSYHFGKGVEPREVEAKLETRVSGVYVLSVDLCSYSAFVRETPELPIATEIMRNFCDRCREEILRSGGAVDRVTGDAIMAFWGITDEVGYRVPLEIGFRFPSRNDGSALSFLPCYELSGHNESWS